MLGTLREERAHRLMTTRQLADKARVALSTLTLIENGHTTPRTKVIRQIVGALGVEPLEVDEFRAAIEKASQPRRKATDASAPAAE